MPSRATGSARPATVPSGSRVVVAVSKGPHEVRATAYVDVPEVAGLSQGAALSRLQDAGVGARVINDYSETYARGKVMAQLPSPGSTVPPDAEAVLLVSSGPRPGRSHEVSLPDVVGRREAEAVAELQAAGLSPQITREYSHAVPAGVVMAQVPDAAWTTSIVRRRPKWWIWLLVLMAALAVIAVAFLLLSQRTTLVPDVVGMTQAEALDAIREAGLDAGRVDQTETEEVEAGQVVEQSPAAGQRVDEGSEVDIVVATGEPVVTMPDVTGESEAQATATLQELGLEVETREQPDDSVPVGRVVSQSPEPGTAVEPGRIVTLAIAIEPAAEEVTVPDVSGITRVDGEETLSGLGLRVVVVENLSTTVSEDVVIAQLPAAGETVRPGDSVALIVSVGAPEDAVTVAAPDLVGEELPDAQAEAARLGLRSQPVPVDGAEGDPNDVVAQWPAAGDALPADGTMVLLYAR